MKTGLLLSFGLCIAAGITARAQNDPASLPARDVHQGLLVAVNPYLSAERYKAKFGKHTPYEAGIVALEVFFRNDNDVPLRLDLKTVRLLIGAPGESRQRLDPLSPEDVADRVLLKPSKDPSQQRPRIPLPGTVGRGSGRDKNWEEFAATLRSAAMSTDVLPPRGTTHGFFYFDINRRFDLLSEARFDVPDLVFMLDKKPLFFFQIDLAPAIH
jgi:hypothetical protein